MDTLVFKDWLEDEGVLEEWLRLRVKCLAGDGHSHVLEERCSKGNDLHYWSAYEGSFRQWIDEAFPEAWMDTGRRWASLSRTWKDMFMYKRTNVHTELLYVEPLPVPGMPLNDSLALALLLAELEAGDGKDRV